MLKRHRILQISSYPPPRAGWGMRVQLLKRHLEQDGHECVVLNIGQSRRIPSPEYETVMSGFDYVRKVWRFSRQGFVAHVHVNGASLQGLALAIAAEVINLVCGRRCVLTFHAGIDQVYFPRHKTPWWLAPAFRLLFTVPKRIICNSESVKAKIREYGVPGEKITPVQAFSRQYLRFEAVPLPGDLEAFFERYDTVLFCYLNIRPKFHPLPLIDGFAALASRRPGVGLVLCGVAGYPEEDLRAAVEDRIARHDISPRLCIVPDLDHDQFLTALSRSSLYVRSHVSDGVCSSVLEALALGIPVVAAENGDRPAGVLTYRHDDPAALTRLLDDTLARRDAIASALPKPDIPDTLSVEAGLLLAS
jgi:glycosyltransferase involved in cell wall biosynthesis